MWVVFVFHFKLSFTLCVLTCSLSVASLIVGLSNQMYVCHGIPYSEWNGWHSSLHSYTGPVLSISVHQDISPRMTYSTLGHYEATLLYFPACLTE